MLPKSTWTESGNGFLLAETTQQTKDKLRLVLKCHFDWSANKIQAFIFT